MAYSIIIGDYEIAEYPEDRIRITHKSGEGLAMKKEEFSKIIDEIWGRIM